MINSNSNHHLGQATHREYEMNFGQPRLQNAAAKPAHHGRIFTVMAALIGVMGMLSLAVQAL